MTNLSGRTLSHYRLADTIGAGGMGEVYRGIDTRLNRPVAVKILPPQLLQDDDRRRRFTHEAKAASALNHPNIVTIYDVGSEAGIDFIVMEHVAGKTLEEIIGRRPMAITPLLRHATQIAEALTAAHAAGIVHRDLKPTNVMVTDQGLVKVLDFGLAKLTEVSPAAADQHTKTEGQGASPTERGIIVGTASYMSPEQAEGGTVDSRSDIFSFGSVMYEMATGRRAFEGSTTMSTIAAVLRDEPRPVSTVTAPLPHDLEVLINRCLKKDPSRRVQHMADLKVALQELKEESESGRLTTSVASVSAPRRRPSWRMAVAALAGVAAVSAVTGWLLFARRAPVPPPPSALTRLTFDTGMTTQPALSPDGKLIAYVSDRATKLPNLWVQQVDSGQAVQLTHLEGGASAPSFSPDGTRISFMGSGKDEGIYVVSTIGGEPRKIASKGEAPRFSPDGSQLSFSLPEGTNYRLMLVPAAGGQPKKVECELTIMTPLSVWSPDGSHVLVLGRVDEKSPATDDIDWFAISLKDGHVIRTGATAALRAEKVLQETAVMTPPNDWSGGAVLFTIRNRDAVNVWSVAMDPATFQLTGPAERLTSGTAQEVSPTMSRDGKLAFAAVDTIQDYWALPIDANSAVVKGPRAQIMKNSASDNQALSLDGNTLLYCSHRGGQSEFRSRDLRSGKETLLVSSATANQHLSSTSADGTVFMYNVPGRVPSLFLGTTSGAPPRKLCDNCAHSTLSKDGTKHLRVIEPDHHTYHVLDIASGRSTELVSSPTKEFSGSSQFAPDDQWVAITTTSNEEMFLVPVRTTKVDEKEMIPIGRVSADGGYQMFRFSPDGNTIYYLSYEDGNGCIYAQRLAANRHPAGSPVVVQHLHEANTWGHPHGMRVGADKIVLLMNQGSSNIWLMQPRP